MGRGTEHQQLIRQNKYSAICWCLPPVTREALIPASHENLAVLTGEPVPWLPVAGGFHQQRSTPGGSSAPATPTAQKTHFIHNVDGFKGDTYSLCTLRQSGS